MIYIELASFVDSVPEEWTERAKSLANDLTDANSAKDRAKILRDHSDMWRDLKPMLAELSNLKCWYCETREVRSDNAVDHFRPKSAVSGEDHPGYWWLAFSALNYRYSCTFCNSRRVDAVNETAGGKHDAFPLQAGSLRAVCPDDAIDAEIPVLLDPCSIVDVDYLWFDETGRVVENPAMVSSDWDRERVSTSVKLYHLDHVRLVQNRRKVYRTISGLLRVADANYRAMCAGDVEASRSYQILLMEIRRHALGSAEYAATARCALLGFRASSGAASAVLRFM